MREVAGRQIAQTKKSVNDCPPPRARLLTQETPGETIPAGVVSNTSPATTYRGGTGCSTASVPPAKTDLFFSGDEISRLIASL